MGREKVLPYVTMPMTYIEKTMTLENCHLATIIVINDVGKSHE